MKYGFHNFMAAVSMQLIFRVEWDNDQWNEQYINFKYWLENISSEYRDLHGPHLLYKEFAKEYYQDATEETHDYWLKKQI